ncbi:MAG TPA: hypothetical protein VFD81_05955, partial [Methylomirabilota bacterium]|nr:hypothetical protein [Methylomirabilota bacterium]
LIPGGWQVGMSPNIQVNWKAEPGNKLTLPIGFGAGKLFKIGKLPLKRRAPISTHTEDRPCWSARRACS